jgi:hypothetical protein
MGRRQKLKSFVVKDFGDDDVIWVCFGAWSLVIHFLGLMRFDVRYDGACELLARIRITNEQVFELVLSIAGNTSHPLLFTSSFYLHDSHPLTTSV